MPVADGALVGAEPSPGVACASAMPPQSRAASIGPTMRRASGMPQRSLRSLALAFSDLDRRAAVLLRLGRDVFVRCCLAKIGGRDHVVRVVCYVCFFEFAEKPL